MHLNTSADDEHPMNEIDAALLGPWSEGMATGLRILQLQACEE
jgi:hypothetical protein